ncbi:pilus assembly protein [Pseudomonas fluorescens]|uniref:Pilus assembly protein n=1 Tax=Pseudomonas fluorescens TaxID=294 RepID=A0A1T2Y1U6_PSEFL|nr:pilus assembly protein [Pseudomonas fluorescens]OPA86091.1 pilus assembly protein [Pseudomonas fluorescens]
MRFSIFLWAASVLFAATAHAGPSINVGVIYDYLEGDKSTYLKRVFNNGDSTAFVKINILEIVYDANGASTEIPVATDSATLVRNGLMASPARLIVPAGGTQGTRLLFIGSRDKERYFRVRFVPVVPEKEDQFAISAEERDSYKKNLSAGISVMAGYGTIFFVRPKDTRFDTQVTNTADKYTLYNNGNSVVVVDEFQDCAINKEADCKPTSKHHILAGRTHSFGKEPGREYRFKLVEGTSTKNVDVVTR